MKKKSILWPIHRNWHCTIYSYYCIYMWFIQCIDKLGICLRYVKKRTHNHSWQKLSIQSEKLHFFLHHRFTQETWSKQKSFVISLNLNFTAFSSKYFLYSQLCLWWVFFYCRHFRLHWQTKFCKYTHLYIYVFICILLLLCDISAYGIMALTATQTSTLLLCRCFSHFCVRACVCVRSIDCVYAI